MSASRLRLVCFHHVGGGSSLFRGWQRALGPHVDVWPVTLPGRDSRADEARHAELGELVAALDAELDAVLAGPHVLFGHSMGALIAYALACQRLGSGANLPRALIVSGYPGVHLPAPLPLIDNRNPRQVISLLTAIGGLPAEVLEWPDGMEQLLPAILDDLRVCSGHGSLAATTLPVPIHAFVGDADPLVTQGDLHAWERYSEFGVDVHVVSGDHFYIRDRPEQLLAELAALLRHYV